MNSINKELNLKKPNTENRSNDVGDRKKQTNNN